VNNKKLQTPVLNAAVNFNGSFTLSWNEISDATKYGIYLQDANGKYNWIATVTGTSYTTDAAPYGKTNSYKVLAVGKNSSITSEYSNAVSISNK
ncbi:MAG: hypothetical protein K2G56_06240, partial [Eubacterium sp.]|nr:hypothetical protein [Eubacterium sp.]